MACLMWILNAFTDILRSPFPLKHLIIIYYDSNILLFVFKHILSLLYYESDIQLSSFSFKHIF